MKPILRSLLVSAVLLAASAARADDDVKIIPDVVYGHKHGMALTFDVFKPKNANGAGVLYMVSGGWFSRWIPPEQAIGRFQPLLSEGFTVFAVRHGSAPKYVIPEAISDVRRSLRFVRLNAQKYGIDPDRLGVTGGSAGGHLSLMLGTTADEGDPDAKDEVLRTGNRAAAVVAYFPPTDVRPWVGEGTPLATMFPALRFDSKKGPDCSPILHVTADDAPTLLVHGDKDSLVTLDHSEKMLGELKKQKVPCELLVIKGAGHGFGGADGKRASDATVAWFKKHLAK